MQTMIQNKQNWTEIKQVLRDMTFNYTEIYKLNRILWYITKGGRKLVDSLGKKDKIDELRLIRDIKETLKKCKFSITYDQCMEEEICQVKQELTEYLEIEIDLHTREDHALLCKERKDLIYEAFKPPIHTTMSTDELSTILGSYNRSMFFCKKGGWQNDLKQKYTRNLPHEQGSRYRA